MVVYRSLLVVNWSNPPVIHTMPTENPKVAGYIPQAVYDKLMSFKAERGLSVSQAITVVLEEYFGFGKVDHTTQRLEDVEGKVSSLAKTVGKLTQAIAALQDSSLLAVYSSLPVNHNEPLGTTIDTQVDHSNPLLPQQVSNLVVDISELPATQQATTPLESPPIEESVSSLEVNYSRLLENTPESQVDESEPLEASSLPIEASEPLVNTSNLLETPVVAVKLKPLTPRDLAERLEINQSTLWRNKERSDFPQWSQIFDPDNIAWEYRSGRKGSPQYHPINRPISR